MHKMKRFVFKFENKLIFNFSFCKLAVWASHIILFIDQVVKGSMSRRHNSKQGIHFSQTYCILYLHLLHKDRYFESFSFSFKSFTTLSRARVLFFRPTKCSPSIHSEFRVFKKASSGHFFEFIWGLTITLAMMSFELRFRGVSSLDGPRLRFFESRKCHLIITFTSNICCT